MFDGRATDFRPQFSGHGQQSVTNLFGLQPPNIKPPAKLITGIDFLSGNSVWVKGRHLPGRRIQNLPVQPFDAPPVGDEFRRQPVEQLWMRGATTETAEVAGRCNKSGAKMLLPHAIHDDSCGQRVIRTRDPFRERRALTGGGIERLSCKRFRVDDRKNRPR